MKIFLLLLVLCCLMTTFVNATKPKNVEITWVKTESTKLAKAVLDEDLEAILQYTIPNTMILPEYQNALETPVEIQDYYAQFFQLTTSKKFTKTIIEVQKIGEYFLEIGNYEHEYKTANTNWFSYKGKYMTWWTKRDSELKILANMWCASSYTDQEHLTFFSIKTQKRNPIIPKSQIAHKVMENVNSAIKVVSNGDYKKQLESYLDDAIYMTYYEPPFIGKKAITEYFSNHYNPATKMDSLAIKPYQLIDMKDYVLTMGKYYVEWGRENIPSFVRGKNLNLYKKMKDGKLMIYRQMVNHSLPPGQKVNP